MESIILAVLLTVIMTGIIQASRIYKEYSEKRKYEKCLNLLLNEGKRGMTIHQSILGILKSKNTPHITVDTKVEGVIVPEKCIVNDSVMHQRF
jgi:PII-like signaling protein